MAIAVTVAILLLGWGIFIYNRLVRDRHRVRTAWSDIDVQLKRRHDLVPKLVETVRQYAAYEQATLERVTALREQGRAVTDAAARGTIEAALGENIQRLLALAESYPDLKADQSFLHLQQQLTEVENHLQYARRYYNGAVNALNVRVDSFPDLLLARPLGFQAAPWFQFEAGQEAT